MNRLWERTLWINNNIDYLFDVNIYEYDIKSAGLNIIKYYNLLTKKDIEFLEKLDKKERNIKIGLIQKNDKGFTKELLEGFKNVRKMFITENNLNEENILAIRKDAIFVIDEKCRISNFRNIEFTLKNQYTSYLRLNKIDFLINSNTGKIDIKGFGQDEILEQIHLYHDDYMLKFIINFVKMKEFNSNTLVYYITEFIKKYRNKNLDVSYYRELSRINKYRVYDTELDEYIYLDYTDSVSDVDILYNYINYIVPIASICI